MAFKRSSVRSRPAPPSQPRRSRNSSRPLSSDRLSLNLVQVGFAKRGSGRTAGVGSGKRIHMKIFEAVTDFLTRGSRRQPYHETKSESER